MNTFPAGSGIASSASSFAALTLGAFLANAQDVAANVELLETEKGTALRRKLARDFARRLGKLLPFFRRTFRSVAGRGRDACVRPSFPRWRISSSSFQRAKRKFLRVKRIFE